MLFVTLTYPRRYPGSWPIWKAQLANWWKRLKRRCPQASVTWKLEPQDRGAPHYHLIITGVPFLAKAWLSRSWYQVVGSKDLRHLAAGTQVQRVKRYRGVLSYAAKYTAKAQQLPADWQDGVGRWWGCYGREAIGISWSWAYLSEREYWVLARVVRGLIWSRQRPRGRSPPKQWSNGGWIVLSDFHAARLLAWLAHLADDR